MGQKKIRGNDVYQSLDEHVQQTQNTYGEKNKSSVNARERHTDESKVPFNGDYRIKYRINPLKQ